jgi:hypothetical protein
MMEIILVGIELTIIALGLLIADRLAELVKILKEALEIEAKK